MTKFRKGLEIDGTTKVSRLGLGVTAFVASLALGAFAGYNFACVWVSESIKTKLEETN